MHFNRVGGDIEFFCYLIIFQTLFFGELENPFLLWRQLVHRCIDQRHKLFAFQLVEDGLVIHGLRCIRLVQGGIGEFAFEFGDNSVSGDDEEIMFGIVYFIESMPGIPYRDKYVLDNILCFEGIFDKEHGAVVDPGVVTVQQGRKGGVATFGDAGKQLFICI